MCLIYLPVMFSSFLCFSFFLLINLHRSRPVHKVVLDIHVLSLLVAQDAALLFRCP